MRGPLQAALRNEYQQHAAAPGAIRAHGDDMGSMGWSTEDGRKRLRDADLDELLRLGADGTAIDWDTECLRTPLDFDAPEWVALGCGVFFLALAAVGTIGALSGWWAA